MKIVIILTEAMVINNCYNATEPTIGLSMSEEHTTRKCYMADTGLLVTHSFMDDKPYILYTKDILIKENVIHLPIYMAMFL